MEWRIWDEQPVLWIVPGVALAFITLINVLDLVLNIVPASLNSVLMAVSSALVSSMSAGFILELMRGRGRLTHYAMAGSWVVGLVVYLAGHGFLESNVVEGTQMASIPLVGAMLTGTILIMVPGLFTGSVVGGVASLIPAEALMVEETEDGVPQLSPGSWPGYEKICVKCGQVMPFDSVFCSQCGSLLKRRLASQVRYCRYCGGRLQLKGEFCPDCGKELTIMSRPKVYVSQ
jgi:RNA polymerase subunit RPABC4/transcription elongation factor Spt4